MKQIVELSRQKKTRTVDEMREIFESAGMFDDCLAKCKMCRTTDIHTQLKHI